MFINKGIDNEYKFIRSINKKQFKNMEFNIQEFLLDLYDNNIHKDDLFFSWKNVNNNKTDIYVRKYNEENNKKISIKMGNKNSIHTEHIEKFLIYLKHNNYSKYYIDILKGYQYKDGTLNGMGSERITAKEYQNKYAKEVNDFNIKINNKDQILSFFDRFLLRGNCLESIDVLIHGTPENFLYIKKKDIYNIALSHLNIKSNSIHFSFLTLQTKNANLKRCIKNEKDRHYIQIKWYNIDDIIIENMNIKTIIK